MTWRIEKTDEGQDFIYDGVENGIAPSPTRGTANIQNANISTETGEILASFSRTQENQTIITNGTLTPDDATLFTAPAALKAGSWILVSSSTVSSITATTGATTASADYLVVAGGGGGGGMTGGSLANGGGGGGGAGGMLTGSTTLSVGSYLMTVGDGGAGDATFRGTNGEDSIFQSVVTATGGGGGGSGSDNASPTTVYNGSNGGSGGGGGGSNTGPYSGTAGTGTVGQGKDGGTGRGAATAAGAGGGGATGAGSTPAGSGLGGAGGAGTASSITGTSVTYAGGGGGGTSGTAGAGGSGGGGAGGDGGAGSDGTDGLGGGGGGGNGGSGGDGGSGVIIVSYVTGSMVATGGTVTYTSTNTVHTFTESGLFTVVAVNPGGLYYVSYENASGKIKLSSKFDPLGQHVVTHGTTGSITFSTYPAAMQTNGIAKATEKYTTSTTTEYRYYVLDAAGYLWYYDTAVYDATLAASGVGTTWICPDWTPYSALKMTGMSVLNGWLMTVSNSRIYGKPTVDLGRAFIAIENAYLNEPFPTHTNYAMTGSQGKMYYCDGNYLGEMFPTTSLVTSVANIQSYGTCTASTTVGTISSIIGGSLPYSPDGTRIPVVFFVDQYGTLPTAITQNTVYYIETTITEGTFFVYTALTGGSKKDISTGLSGTLYFNTFYPVGAEAGINGSASLVQYSSQRLNLPFYETAQCLVEVGNTVIVGCNGSILYPWNQVDATPSDLIALPEANVKTMVNVNNMAYVFAGNKGNIYITNNSVASLTLKVSDYVAGVPGTPLTYIEPYFTWGDSMYVRGRVYFSILDQTSTKAGNCGGVWSFIPPQNVDPSQSIGMALRLENQNSYGDYDGYATLLIPNEEQVAIAPQYWAAWQDSYSTGSAAFGIDNTGTTPVTTYILETDLLPTGSMLSKDTFTQVEYKLTTQLASGDSIQLYYRTNSTDAWTTCGTVVEEPLNRISGYFSANFQKTQWLQIRAVATTSGTTASSFVRLKQIHLRK